MICASIEVDSIFGGAQLDSLGRAVCSRLERVVAEAAHCGALSREVEGRVAANDDAVDPNPVVPLPR